MFIVAMNLMIYFKRNEGRYYEVCTRIAVWRNPSYFNVSPTVHVRNNIRSLRIHAINSNFSARNTFIARLYSQNIKIGFKIVVIFKILFLNLLNRDGLQLLLAKSIHTFLPVNVI